MKHKSSYDLVVLVSNDLTHDRRIQRTCQALSSKGWDVLLIGRCLKPSTHVTFSEWDVHRIKCHYTSGPIFYLELPIRFKRLLKSITFTHLLCVDEDTLGVLNLMDTQKIKVYFDAHELFTEVPELDGKLLKKWIWNKWSGRAIKKVDHAYTVNESIAQILIKKYKRNFNYVWNVPELAKSDVPYSQSSWNPKHLVYIGVLNPGRGLELLINSIPGFPKLHLTIIGDGPEYGKLKKLSGNSTQITFLGSKEPDEIPTLLLQYDVGVNLLTPESLSYYYSLSNKFFDYIHAGIPVLCMDFPEYQKINLDYQCIYPVRKYAKDNIEAALRQIASDDAYEQKCTQARLVAKLYNWNTEKERLFEIYNF